MVLKLKVSDHVWNDAFGDQMNNVQVNYRYGLCAATHLWLNIHQTHLVLTQNFMNGLQTGAIQIIFVLPVLDKSADGNSSRRF